MAYTKHATWFCVLALLGSACGSDSKTDVESRADMGADAAAGTGSESDEESATDAEETGEAVSDEDATDEMSEEDGTTSATDEASEDTDATSGDAGGPEPPTFEPPDPILPDADPETPVEDLSDDEFEQVCDAYLETSGDLLENYGSFCGIQAVTEAQESGVTDTDEYRAVCAESLAVCENEAATVTTVIDALECSQEGCSATVGEFDACRTQIAALDAILFEPLSEVEAPSCDEVTPAIGQAFSLRVAAIALVSFAQLSDAEGGSVLSDDNACDSISEQCPDFAVPVGADVLTGGGGEEPMSTPADDAGAP